MQRVGSAPILCVNVKFDADGDTNFDVDNKGEQTFTSVSTCSLNIVTMGIKNGNFDSLH